MYLHIATFSPPQSDLISGKPCREIASRKLASAVDDRLLSAQLRYVIVQEKPSIAP